MMVVELVEWPPVAHDHLATNELSLLDNQTSWKVPAVCPSGNILACVWASQDLDGCLFADF